MALLHQLLLTSLLSLTCSSQPPHNSLTSSLLSKAGEPEDLPDFLSQCVQLAELGVGLQCSGLLCEGEEGRDLSLEVLQHQQCQEDADCLQELTGLTCSTGRCDCPRYTAFNLSSCACQETASCHYPVVDGLRNKTGCSEHNGRKCQDPYCSCYSSPDYTNLLIDPTSLFCVLPAGPSDLARGGGANSIGLAVLGALLGFLSVVILAVFIVAMYKHCVCERGDYKCDAPDGDIPENHIAAWNHPSMDYVSKDDENIIFTLCQASDTVRMSNASTIYVQDEETTSYIRTDHENMAYVEEEDPRND